jgi:hypothetical protein
VEVRTTTISAFCDAHAIGRVDVLKLDVQGAERLVLEGAREMLEQGAVGLVFAEVLFAKLYDGGTSFDELWRWLETAGYALYGLFHLTPGDNGLLGYGDAIFVGPELRASLES